MLVMDTTALGKRIPYEKLGRHHPLSELFIASIVFDRKVPFIDSLIAVLKTIVAHLSGKEVQVRGYSNGLNAYDAWIQVLQKPVNTDLFYIAMNADVVAEARKHASIFLNRLLNRQDVAGMSPSAKEETEVLANLYREISESWHRLAELLWRSREEKLPSELWQPEAVHLLTDSKQSEAQAANKAAVLLNKIV
jgi:hypothetical protein